MTSFLGRCLLVSTVLIGLPWLATIIGNAVTS